MDREIARSLKKALDLIQAGNPQEARPILVEILKHDSEIEQAWFMLSFVVPNHERQVFAIKHALRINPDNPKSRSRLEKLISGSQPTPAQAEKSLKDSPAKKQVESKPSPAVTTSTPSSDDDLLSQRLFGDSASSGEADEDSSPVSDAVSALPEKLNDQEDKKEKKRRKRKKKKEQGEGSTRKVLVILLLIIILGGGGVVGMDYLGIYDLGIFGGGINSDNQTSEQETELPIPIDESTPKETLPAETPTPTETIVPTITKTPLPTPTRAPTATEVLLPPSDDIQNTIIELQGQAEQIRGLAPLNAPQTFIVSQSKIKDVLHGMFSSTDFELFSDRQMDIYFALGITDLAYNFKTHNKNQWGDLYSSIYSPDSMMIFMINPRFGPVQNYAYIQEHTLSMLEEEFQYSEMGFLPICELSFQECQAILALIKGDATLTSEQWVSRYSSSDKTIIEEQAVQPFVISDQIPPAFARIDLLFPYEYGTEFVKAIFARGGWTAVNQIYLDPPKTTEQIMHPEKYREGEVGLEVDNVLLSGILGDEWTELMNESLGEWLTYLFLAYGNNINGRIDLEIAAEAVEGWGGDRTQIYINESGTNYVTVIHWVGDTQVDSTQFYQAVLLSLEGRFSFVDPYQPYTELDMTCWEPTLEIVCLWDRDVDVIMMSGPDLDIIDGIISLYAIE